jgi:rhamnogalacturonan endolyase
MLDARTGKVLWTTPTDKDTGRGLAADIDPRHPGDEAWGTNSDLSTPPRARRSKASSIRARPTSPSGGTATTLRELLDKNQISKWDWTAGEAKPLLTAEGMTSNNGTKSTPALSADILGDWREEVLWRAEDNQSLRLYVTPYPTDVHHDPDARPRIPAQRSPGRTPPTTSRRIPASSSARA